ncbi:thioesterase [Nocardia donostiensis]|uniref:Thioesterase n=2 Tax=Nocardia donostiensis TaxID=1538463 RepID=A0A1V2TK07_9NOCA|nr:thioesterase [Nocardia donostiensis]OQS15417.1 thioesterase [Nocardia donostiensis]OQS16994.1 thioesterase [Nocardia donostiensis]
MTQQQTEAPMSLAGITPEQMTKYSEGTFTDLIGLRFTELSEDLVRGEWTVTPKLHQPAGIQNGGVLCTVIESLASTGAQVWYGDQGAVVGVHNSTDFLRAVREGTLTAEATPIHRGRLQQLWQVVVTDESGRQIARGQVRLQNLPHRS